MNWLIDLGALVFIAVMTFLGFKKGLVKSLIGLIGFILALVLSFTLSGPVAELTYDNFISDAAKDYISDSLGSLTGKAPGDAGQPLYMASPSTASDHISYQDLLKQLQKSPGTETLTADEIASISSQILQGATLEEVVNEYNQATDAKADATQIAKSLGVEKNTPVSGASEKSQTILGIDVGKIVKNMIADAIDVDSVTNDIVDGTLRPMVIGILKSIIFVVLFIILGLLFALISGAVGKLVTKIPIVGPVNAVLGGVFGFAKGVGWAAILLIIITMLAKGSANESFRNAADQSLGCSLVENWVPDFE